MAVNGATTAGRADATVKTIGTGLTSGTSEAASGNGCTTGSASGNGTGNRATRVIDQNFPAVAAPHLLRYVHGRHRPGGTSGTETFPWESTPSERDGAQEMGRCPLALPTRIPCLRSRPSAAVLAAAQDEAWDEAEGTGTRGAGTGGPSTTRETVTHEVGRRKADGDGIRKIGIVDTRTRPGTPETTVKSGTGKTASATSSVRSRTGSRTNHRRPRTSRLHPSLHPLPLLARSRAARRHPPKSSP